MADETDPEVAQPGPQEPGDVEVSSLGTRTEVTPTGALLATGGAAPARVAPPAAFPSPGLPYWIPTPAQIAQQKQQQELDDLSRNISSLPTDQAQRATVAALKFQGQRGYQADLAAGKTSAEALARWAPMLFADRPQTFGSALRTAYSPRPAPRWVPPDPNTGAPGHFETSAGVVTGVQPPATQGQPVFTPPNPTTGAPGFFTGPRVQFAPQPKPLEKPGALTQVERDDLTFAERQLTRLETAQNQDDEGARAVSLKASDQTTGQRAAAERYSARERQIRDLNNKIDSYHSRVSQAATVRPPEGEALPLPSKKEDLKVGTRYRTRDGVRIWTGEKLRKPQTSLNQ